MLEGFKSGLPDRKEPKRSLDDVIERGRKAFREQSESGNAERAQTETDAAARESARESARRYDPTSLD